MLMGKPVVEVKLVQTFLPSVILLAPSGECSWLVTIISHMDASYSH